MASSAEDTPTHVDGPGFVRLRSRLLGEWISNEVAKGKWQAGGLGRNVSASRFQILFVKEEIRNTIPQFRLDRRPNRLRVLVHLGDQHNQAAPAPLSNASCFQELGSDFLPDLGVGWCLFESFTLAKNEFAVAARNKIYISLLGPILVLNPWRARKSLDGTSVVRTAQSVQLE